MRARLRQIWGPLYAVALVLGEDWPARCIAAFKAMALDASEQVVLSGEQMVLRDVAAQFAATGADRLFTRDIGIWLRALPADEDDYYNDLSDRGLAMKITAALGPAQSMDIGQERAKGYHAGPVMAAWKRLEARLDPPEPEDEDIDEFESFFEVTQVTESVPVTEPQNPAQHAPSRSSRSSRKIDEPEMSLISPPCEQDSNGSRRRPKVQTAAGQGDDKFRIETLKEKGNGNGR
jgi:Protein of unknown function (DUF3631)